MRRGIIYEPSGAAGEYAKLALNHFRGCTHRCRYCYGPGVLRKSKGDYFRAADPKKKVIEQVDSSCAALSWRGNKDEILLNFIGDPYQHEVEARDLTRAVLCRLIDWGQPFNILTKGGTRACGDFDLLESYSAVRFGTSLVFWDQESVDYWEPGAASIKNRIEAIERAKAMGIPTWVSLEPVIDPDQALRLIKEIHGIVDHWWVGKINRYKAAERKVDWVAFTARVEGLLQQLGASYNIKRSLRDIAGGRKEEKKNVARGAGPQRHNCRV